MKKIHHRYVVRGGLMPDIHERKNVTRVGLIGKKLLHGHAPLLFFGFGNFGVAVTGEIGKNKLAEIEIIDQSRAPRGVGCFCKLFLIGKHVDERTFADVGLAHHRYYRFIGLYKLRGRSRGSYERCVFYNHAADLNANSCPKSPRLTLRLRSIRE